MVALLKIAFAMVLEALNHVTPAQLAAVKQIVIDFLSKLVAHPSPAANVVAGTFAAFDGSEVPTL